MRGCHDTGHAMILLLLTAKNAHAHSRHILYIRTVAPRSNCGVKGPALFIRATDATVFRHHMHLKHIEYMDGLCQDTHSQCCCCNVQSQMMGRIHAQLSLLP